MTFKRNHFFCNKSSVFVIRSKLNDPKKHYIENVEVSFVVFPSVLPDLRSSKNNNKWIDATKSKKKNRQFNRIHMQYV